MSQDTIAKWLFKHFVSDSPERDFSHVIDLDLSQVLDLEAEVKERQKRISQIPQSRRVKVLEEVVLDVPCGYVKNDAQEAQDYIDNFDLSYLTPNVNNQNVDPLPGHSRDMGYMVPNASTSTTPETVLPGHSRDRVYMNNQNTDPLPGHSRDMNYMNNQTGSGGLSMNQSLQNHICTDCPEHYHTRWPLSQRGRGMRRRSAPELFTVGRHATRVYKKFNMQGTYYKVQILPPAVGCNAEHWLRALLNGIINYFKSSSKIDIRPGDYIGMELKNPAFDEKSVYVGLRRSDQLDADVIFEKILSIFDSNKEFFMNGEMEVEFSHIQMPHGSGNRVKKQFGQTDEEFIKGKASFLKYTNPQRRYETDEYCLPYAIVLGKASLDKDKKNLRRYTTGMKQLRIAALNLCRAAGITVKPGGCSIGDVAKFQAILPNYQIVVYRSLDPKQKPYTDLAYYQPKNKINILLNNGHYNAMRSLKACFASDYICPDCQTRAPSRLKHKKCVYTCPFCLSRPPCTPVASSEMIRCRDCLRSFRGRECFMNHLKTGDHEHFSACDRIKSCPDCDAGYYVDVANPHECGFYYCVTCEKKQPNEHQCHMSVYKTKRNPDDNILYVVYDFETQQNTLLETGKYKHKPNLCVVKTACSTCREEEDLSIPCHDCGIREQIFFSEDCVENLLDFIVYKGNERKEEGEEEEEEGPQRKGPRAKKFKKILAIAHNMGGFDGQFIMNYLLKSNRFNNPKLIMNGTRLIQMNLGYNVTLLDSLNYFHDSLANLPKMFGFAGSKGYYPHLFNTPENAGKEGPLPEKHYYSPESMSVAGRIEFDKWYDSQPKDYKFNNDRELIEYCRQDVAILLKACLKFANDFWEVNKIDPFLDACTIAGACSKVFRSNYLEPDTIGILPTNGYRYRDNQSKIALKWLSLIELREGIEIQHAARTVEKYITGVGKVDGYHEASNTVFEFMGCFYHGCERCYPNQYLSRGYNQPGYGEVPLYMNELNVSNEDDERNQKMFIRRENTAKKCQRIRDAGYNLVIMKECVFRRELRQDRESADLLADLPILKNEPLNPRDAFYGGRTNATKLYFKSDGETKMYYYDICSLYPYINKTSKIPIGHPEVYIGDICDMIPWQGMDGLMKVTVTPPKGLYNPVLPARMHSKLMFFLCTVCAKTLNKCACDHTEEERALTGTWVIDEVKLALERGYEIKKIHEIWEYQVTQYDRETKEGGIFVGYINRFLKMKTEASGWPKTCKTEADKDAYINAFYEREGILLDKSQIKYNAALRSLAKTQLNSFWGRFGLRPDLIRTIIVNTYDELIMKMLDPNLEMDSIVPVNDDNLLLNYREKEEARHPNKTANVVIAAFTTAYARMELYKYLDMLGPDRIWYFDTDSIFFTAKPGELMPEKGPFLGQMTCELEKDYGEDSHIIEFCSGGPKNYAFKVFSTLTGQTSVVVKVKGITLNHETSGVINFDLIKQFVFASVQKPKTENVEASVGSENSIPTTGVEQKRRGRKRKKAPEPNTVEVGLNSIRRTNIGEVYSTRVTKTYRVKYTKRQLKEDYDTLPYGY